MRKAKTVAVIYFFLTLFALMLATSLDVLFSTFKFTAELNPITLIENLFTSRQILMWFLVLELGFALFLFYVYQNISLTSSSQRITDDIYTPYPAQSTQCGSAKWLYNKDKAFSNISKSEILRRLE